MIQKITLGIAVLALLLGGVAISSKSGVVGGTSQYQKMSFVEGLTAGKGKELSINRDGRLNFRESTRSVTSATTLKTTDSGQTVYINTNGATYTLPAVTKSAGVSFKFVVASAFGTANAVIASAEGDNIDGTLIVAGAVVDCRGEDFINFINDGEALGDFVEVRSNGVQWFIGASGGLTSAKITCTDPS